MGAGIICKRLLQLLLAGLIVGCGSGGGGDSSYGSAVNKDYKIEKLECDGPTSIHFSQGGVAIDVDDMSSCTEAHSPQKTNTKDLPERMMLEDYEYNITNGTAAFDIELGLRDFAHYSLDAATLKLEIDRSVVSNEVLTNVNVLARIYDIDDDTVFDVTGSLVGNTLMITSPGLPNRFYVAVIYNPKMRSVASEKINEGSWPVRRWCVLYDVENSSLVKSAALLYGTPEPSEEQIKNTAQTLILDDIEEAQAYASTKNFAAPADRIVDSAGDPCSELAAEPRYLLAYELINREVLAEPGIFMLSIPQYTFGVFNLKSQLLASASVAENKSIELRAFPTAVNDQITDSVTLVNGQVTESVSQVNTKVIGDAPAMAMGNLYQAMSHAIGNAAQNAVYAQQQATVTSQAATTMGVTTLYSIDTASNGSAPASIFKSQLRLDTATPNGKTLDDVSNLADDTFYLDNWLLTSSSPRSNQDFFAYVGRRFDHESLAYLIPLIQEIGNAVEDSANAAETPERRAGILFEPDLRTVRVAIDSFFKRIFGVGLVGAYLEFITERAVKHDAESILRSDDLTNGFTAALFHADTNNQEDSSLVEVGFDGSDLTPPKGTFGNIAPFASRAIYIPAKAIIESGAEILRIEFSSSTGSIGDTIQGSVCQGVSCAPLTQDISIFEPASGAAADIVILIANVSMDGINDVSFHISTTSGN